MQKPPKGIKHNDTQKARKRKERAQTNRQRV